MRVWKGPYSARICSVESHAIQNVSLYAITYLAWGPGRHSMRPSGLGTTFWIEAIRVPSRSCEKQLVGEDFGAGRGCMRAAGNASFCNVLPAKEQPAPKLLERRSYSPRPRPGVGG